MLKDLGFFNPIATGNATELKLNLKRVEYWVMNGAQLSGKMHYLVKKYKKLNLEN